MTTAHAMQLHGIKDNHTRGRVSTVEVQAAIDAVDALIVGLDKVPQ